jgi:hypothetical protein
MYESDILPWPRGTFSDDVGVIVDDDTTLSEFEGKEYVVPDDQHGFAEPVTLRVVKNDSGGDITVARKGYEFSVASQGDFGSRIAGTCEAGEIGFPIDDAYSVGQTWPQFALGYVVVKGRCDVLTAATNVNYAAGINVSWANGGVLNDAAAVPAGAFVVGTLEYESAYAVNTAVCVYVGKQAALPPAAG